MRFKDYVIGITFPMYRYERKIKLIILIIFDIHIKNLDNNKFQDFIPSYSRTLFDHNRVGLGPITYK